MIIIKSRLIKLLIFFVALFAIGGWVAVGEGLAVLGGIFKGFFPIFFDVAKSSIEEYLTSPYFIVGIIMAIASGFGIWFGKQGGRILYLIVSVIFEIFSLASILMNLV